MRWVYGYKDLERYKNIIPPLEEDVVGDTSSEEGAKIDREEDEASVFVSSICDNDDVEG